MKTQKDFGLLGLAEELARDLSRFQEISAIALGGSLEGGYQDSQSDIDLYVYFAEAKGSRLHSEVKFWISDRCKQEK